MTFKTTQAFWPQFLSFSWFPGQALLPSSTPPPGTASAPGSARFLERSPVTFYSWLRLLAGLAAVMNSNPIFFQALQWFGAAYLCWLGLQLLRSPLAQDATTPEPHKSAWRYFRQACAVSLTNPKVVLFFVAFFPLFLRPGSSNTTLVAMMAHVTIISFLYQAGLVLVGNAVALRLRAIPSARKIATRLAGIALIGFGVKLATSNR